MYMAGKRDQGTSVGVLSSALTSPSFSAPPFPLTGAATS